MTRRFLLFGAALATCGCQQTAQATASPVKVGIVARADGSPSSASAAALETLARQAGANADVQFLQSRDRDDDVGRLQLLAVQNYTTILGVGSELAPAVARVAQAAPKLQFVVIDGFADGPNIDSVAIDDAQPAFLAGALAALASVRGRVAVIDNIGSQRRARFRAAFRAGVRKADPATALTFVTATAPGIAGAVHDQKNAGVDSIAVAGGGPGVDQALAALSGVNTIAYGFESEAAVATVPDALALAVKVGLEQAQAQKVPSGPSIVGPADGLRLRTNPARYGRLAPAARAHFERIAAGVADGSIAVSAGV